MQCPVCGRPADDGQRFCTGCGTSLAGRDDTDLPATSAIPVQPGTDPDPDTEDADWQPEWAPTGSVPTTGASESPTEQLAQAEPAWASPTTAALPSTEPLAATDDPADDTGVLTPYDYTDGEPTSGWSTTPDTEVIAAAPYAEPVRHRPRFRATATVVLGVASGLVALAALFTTILSIEASRGLFVADNQPAAFRTGTWIIDDLADNLSIAGLLAAVAMVAGGVASGFGWRWGGGLAGGAGLAYTGVAAIAVGLAQVPIDAAHEFALIPADPPFTLTITRDVGYYLLIVASVLGIVLFFASLNDLTDRRPGLNPWIAALGGLATVIAVAGPLLPEGLARFSDNWYLVDAPGEPPALLLVGRAVQLAMLLVCGLLGFLCVRRYGIGLAAGGSLPFIWMAVSTMFDLTDHPVGPAFRNPGSTDVDLHGLTVIGAAALASMLLLAIVAAYDQSVRERPYR